MVKSIESRLNKVLAVMAEELEGGKHGQASICRKDQRTSESSEREVSARESIHTSDNVRCNS